MLFFFSAYIIFVEKNNCPVGEHSALRNESTNICIDPYLLYLHHLNLEMDTVAEKLDLSIQVYFQNRYWPMLMFLFLYRETKF